MVLECSIDTITFIDFSIPDGYKTLKLFFNLKKKCFLIFFFQKQIFITVLNNRV